MGVLAARRILSLGVDGVFGVFGVWKNTRIPEKAVFCLPVNCCHKTELNQKC